MKQQLITLLLQYRIIKFNFKKPFTFKSQLRSPIYVDLRECMKHYKVMELIKNLFKVKIEKNSIDGIVGIATGSIAHGQLLNTEYRLPFGYVRLDKKSYGMGKNIEGIDVAGKRVVVIEDTVSTAGSILNSIRALEEAGAIHIRPLCIYSHEMKESKEGFEKVGYNLEPIITFTDIIYSQAGKEFLSAEQYELLSSWKSDPKNWFELHKDQFEEETI